MAENKTPKIRFKGFTDDWKERKLGDVGQTYTGLSGKSKIDFGKGNGRFITYMNVFSNPVANPSMVDAIGIDERQNNVKVGDVFFTTSSETPEEVGMTSVLLDNMNNTYLNSFCFGYRPIAKFNNYYLAYMLRSSSLRKQIIFLAQGISRYNISKNKVMEISAPIPETTEQNNVGNFFKDLDNLITLHQRKYDKLVNVKKAMLEKMFPKNGADVPEIRFKGFTDSWEQSKFDEIFVILQNNTLSRAELINDEGVGKNVHYGDILIKLGECLDVKREKLPSITNVELVLKYKTSYLKNGDVIIADTAEDETVGKCSEIVGLLDEILISGLHTIPCRPNRNFASGYLGYYMNSKEYHNQLFPLMQGIKVTSISKNALRTINLLYPNSENEQNKIAQIFKHIDNLINLNQQELAKLNNIKKSCLEKMFV